MNIGEKLKQARSGAKLTQEVVAEKVGVSRQTMSNWENGKSYPDIISVITLSNVYGVTLDSLLKRDNDMIKHLKESIDVTKSNKQIVISLVIFLAMNAIYHLLRHFVQISEATNTVFNIIIMMAFVAVLIVALVRQVSVKQFLEHKNSNKSIVKISGIFLYALIYIPLVLYTPEAINAEFQIGASGLQATIRVVAAFVWLIPAFAIYQKLKCFFVTQ